MPRTSRREFLATGAAVLATAAGGRSLPAAETSSPTSGAKMSLGLVTYLWGQDWDLPTLLANCEKTRMAAVELRTTHKHGVEPSLGKAQRAEVKKRFADSPVKFAGPGSNERFDDPDPAVLAKALQAAKAFVVLSHDCGGSGVKVKPDSFHKGVPHEKTIDQIGRSLGKLGRFAADYGQQIRLEVHGQCAELPTIKSILDVADNPQVAICWNSNPQDLAGEGLAKNFRLVRDLFGRTCHVHELDGKYPYDELFGLLVASKYDGWVLLECSSKPDDRIAAMRRQRELFDKLVAKSTSR